MCADKNLNLKHVDDEFKGVTEMLNRENKKPMQMSRNRFNKKVLWKGCI